MKLLELHILQSYPVTCLNRDDIGSPKSAVFGGSTRARISSQSLKRAIREYAQTVFPSAAFAGQRSRYLLERFSKAIVAAGLAEPEATKKAEELAAIFSSLQDPKERQKSGDVTTAVFLSPAEIEQLARVAADGGDLAKAARKVTRLDAADIALFGRMVANDSSLNVEGASLFSHAISTHRCDNDTDFFSAIDDVKRAAVGTTDAGAGMIGNIDFNSACYYRYCALNLDELARPTHLGGLSQEQRRAVVDAFLRATLQAIPAARKHSMNGHTLPGYALGIYKAAGQPLQLVNAFEKPVTTRGEGYLEGSRERLTEHHRELKDTWGLKNDLELELPGLTLDGFITQLVTHVP
ncbi:MAG: type I-E CRISPR-associated protein Cas7/Cse4/CasC [Verrucomicrobiales bacterium]